MHLICNCLMNPSLATRGTASWTIYYSAVRGGLAAKLTHHGGMDDTPYPMSCSPQISVEWLSISWKPGAPTEASSLCGHELSPGTRSLGRHAAARGEGAKPPQAEDQVTKRMKPAYTVIMPPRAFGQSRFRLRTRPAVDLMHY